MTPTDPLPTLPERYAIDREIGRGGMAVVYRARDLHYDRDVAIKVLRPEVAYSVPVERFLREIAVTARLQHPLIVPLLDSGVTTDALGRPFYVMPLMRGESLRDRLTRAAQLDGATVQRIAAEIAEALDYAHGEGVVHRDIKPENVLLHEGHALVADFGIAQAARRATVDESGRLTETGLSLGTPAYMSPEQASGERDLDGRSDQYSLACVMYEMVAGRPPFKAASAAAMIARQITTDAPFLADVVPTVPPGVAHAVRRAMAKAPMDRFDSNAAFMAACTDAGGTRADVDRSLVVLPFENLSSEPDFAYFADGLTDELLTDLSRVRALRVISRTTSMRLRGTSRDLPTLGRELGVRYALQGSVRRALSKIRITAQLVDLASDAPVWADKFAGITDDVFVVQERVSRAIVDALGATLTAAESNALGGRAVKDARAYELYLQARVGTLGFDDAALRQSLQHLDQALAIEGDNALLLGLKGQILGWMIWQGSPDPTLADRARACASRARDLDEHSIHAHAVLGFTAVATGDIATALEHYTRVLALEPNNADGWFGLCGCYTTGGKGEAARVAAQRYRDADPENPNAWLFLSIERWFAGKAAEGIPFIERCLALSPRGAFPRWHAAYNYALVGRWSDAQRMLDHHAAVDPDSPYTAQMRSLVLSAAGAHTEALAALAPVADRALGAHTTFHVAEALAMCGATERALQYLERAVRTGFYPVNRFIAHECPFLASLRGLPQFEAIVRLARERSDALTV